MKLEQLVHAVEVANTQSISKAASNLLLSQPGLSSSIKQLEYELGTELFVRSKKGVELTTVGSSFVMYAKKVLEQVQAMEDLCKEQSTPIYPFRGRLPFPLCQRFCGYAAEKAQK